MPNKIPFCAQCDLHWLINASSVDKDLLDPKAKAQGQRRPQGQVQELLLK